MDTLLIKGVIVNSCVIKLKVVRASLRETPNKIATNANEPVSFNFSGIIPNDLEEVGWKILMSYKEWMDR